MNKIFKKISIMILAVMLLASCDNKSSADPHVQSTTTGVADVLASRMSDEGETEDKTTDTSDTVTSGTVVAYGSCDIDLTTMNADLVYANVYSLVSSPDSFVGTSVRMRGTALSSTDESTGTTYHACFIADAAGCCSAGLEYRLEDGEYPEDGEEITIVGIFDVYEDGGNPYVILDSAVREF